MAKAGEITINVVVVDLGDDDFDLSSIGRDDTVLVSGLTIDVNVFLPITVGIGRFVHSFMVKYKGIKVIKEDGEPLVTESDGDGVVSELEDLIWEFLGFDIERMNREKRNFEKLCERLKELNGDGYNAKLIYN